MTIFRGLSAFPITPSDETGRVDVPALERILDRLVEAKVDSIGLLGSTGTSPYLARPERRRAIEAAARHVGGRIPILVGIGALRTEEVVGLAQDASEAGAAALLLPPVSYTPLTDREVFTLFETVSGATDLPICVYNNPGTTHFTFSPELVGRLSRLPNVVAVKNPAPADDAAGHLATLRGQVAPGFSLGYSTDWNIAGALLAGGEVWYGVAAGLFPKPCLRLMRAAERGDRADVLAANEALRPLWDLFRELSSLRVMYAAARALGLCDRDPPRPILPLEQADVRRVAEVVAEFA